MSIATHSADQSRISAVGVSPRAKAFLFAAVAIIVIITVARTWIWWRADAGISFASGVMITMASDVTHGVFYRPLFGPLGYGGTRYFPLYFCLHALLLKLGLPVLFSAYLLSASAILLLMLGTYRLLRELEAETWLAWCAALMLLAAASIQLSLTTPQADGLAAALNVWALAMIVPAKPSSRGIFLAALFFTLAWSAKLTTVFGVAAALVWLLAVGRKRAAWLLAAETLCGYLIVAGATVVASGHRVVEIFRACASGGADWKFIVNGPMRMQSMALYTDPVLFAFTVLGLLLLAAMLVSGKLWRSLPALFLIATLAVTILIFGSPGTAGNHLLDLQVAAVILLANCVAHTTKPWHKQLGVYGLALLTLLAAFVLWRNMKTWSRWYHPHQFQHVIAAIPSSGKPILAENPILPVLAGQQPYVQDPWMVQLLRTHFPGFQQPLLDRLRHQDFSAVVLTSGNIGENGAQGWFDNNSFGPGFVSALNDHYKLALQIDKDWIYLPRTEAAASIEPK
jgi:hypothetical protein